MNKFSTVLRNNSIKSSSTLFTENHIVDSQVSSTVPWMVKTQIFRHRSSFLTIWAMKSSKDWENNGFKMHNSNGWSRVILCQRRLFWSVTKPEQLLLRTKWKQSTWAKCSKCLKSQRNLSSIMQRWIQELRTPSTLTLQFLATSNSESSPTNSLPFFRFSLPCSTSHSLISLETRNSLDMLFRVNLAARTRYLEDKLLSNLVFMALNSSNPGSTLSWVSWLQRRSFSLLSRSRKSRTRNKRVSVWRLRTSLPKQLRIGSTFKETILILNLWVFKMLHLFLRALLRKLPWRR